MKNLVPSSKNANIGIPLNFNIYILKARLLPAVMSIGIPIFIFNYFFVNKEFVNFINSIFGLKIIYNLTVPIIILFFLSEIARFLGKNLFERVYFKEEQEMPTTTLLTFKDNTYSYSYKNKIRKKILSDFKISLAGEMEELDNEPLARKRIYEVVTLIRKKLFNNKFLLQHNAEYGAMRNMVGGSVIGICLSSFNIIFFSWIFKSALAVYISVFTLFVYLVIIFFSRITFKFYGRNYAKILYREYLGK